MKLTSCVIRPHKNPCWVYPCLGASSVDKDSSLIVLFHADKSGVIINSEGIAFRVGASSSHWDMDQFEPFYGSVTITSSPDKVEGARGAD